VARKIDEITLSYTFYPVDKPRAALAALDKPSRVRVSAATNSNILKDRG